GSNSSRASTVGCPGGTGTFANASLPAGSQWAYQLSGTISQSNGVNSYGGGRSIYGRRQRQYQFRNGRFLWKQLQRKVQHQQQRHRKHHGGAREWGANL